MDYRIKYSVNSLILVVTIRALFPINSFAQDGPLDNQFHGSNILTSQYANKLDSDSSRPQNYLRNELEMILSLKGVPFATSLYITNENNDMSKRINNMRFYVDLNTLRMNKARIESRKNKNSSDDAKAPRHLRFLSNFSKIEGGMFRPNYGELTLGRIPVSGLNLEFNNQMLYVAFATGQTKKDLYSSGLRQSYKQNLIFGKLGVGQKMKNHLYFTYMVIKDESNSELLDSRKANAKFNPGANRVFGTEFHLAFFKHRWIIDGEAGGSELTRDIRYKQLPDSSFSSAIPDFILNIAEPNVSSSFDYSYRFSSKISLPTTKISASYRWVGPGYYTLGNPNLLNDRETMEGKFDQLFLNRKLSLSAFYKKYSNNLKKTKDQTMNNKSYGITAKLVLRNLPFFLISYIPNKQKSSRNDLIESTYNVNVLNFSSGYNYTIKNKLRAYTGLNYFAQKSNYNYDQYSDSSFNQTIAVTQALNFKPVQINCNLRYTTIEHNDLNIISFDLYGTNSSFEDKWKNTLGLKRMNSSTENVTQPLLPIEDKLSFYWQSQIQLLKNAQNKLLKNVSFSLNLYNNIYKNNRDNSDDNFNEWVMQSTLSIMW